MQLKISEKPIISKMMKAIDIERLKKDKAYRLKFIKKILPYVLFFFIGNKLGYFYHCSRAPNIIGKSMDMLNGLSNIFASPLISIHPKDILTGIATAIMIKLTVYMKGKNAKKYRKGKEYGSAEFGTEKDIEPFINRKKPDYNLIFTQTEQMSLEGRMPNPLLNRNKNVLIVGGSGSGKTRFYAKPNIMTLACSLVVTDPKGTIVEECGLMLKNNGYKVKVLNTINFKKSMHYNPFSYIKSEKDIMKVADALIEGTTTGKQSGDQFWTDAERLLYNALIGYIMSRGVKREQNFTTLLNMVNAMEVREDDESFKNTVDYMFEELEEENPDDYAVLQYKKFKMAAGKTMKSILITVSARLSRFDIKEVREMMEDDDMELDKLGDSKCALFIITSDTTKTFNFIATILYTQLFNLLCEKADNEYHGRLPEHVHCIMDEFANLGKIPDWEILISTIRSREISASIILQSLAQLKSIYDKAADIISDNCDTFLFLGGKGRDTLKEISETLGKETIDLYNTSDTRGNSPSYGTNYQKTGRDLFTPDELARMPGDKCILQIKGVKPFYSTKFDIEGHKRYKQLADYDKANTWHIEQELSTDAVLKSNTVTEHFNFSDTESDNSA